ncbi:MAG: TetR/AcrR family transcriptional regulator [Pseudomonadota bacterium]
MSDVKKKRGRPASIDTAKAMEAVVELFRSKGYAAVSLDDLSDATGLSRPSLYRSFGNKQAMYLGAMDVFGGQVATTAVPALLDEEGIERALAAFYKAMLDIYYRDSAVTPGCLVYGTAPSSSDEGPIQARLKLSIEQLDAFMQKRFERAAPQADAAQIKAAVQIAANTLIAFSARAKSGAPKAELITMGRASAKSVARLLTD